MRSSAESQNWVIKCQLEQARTGAEHQGQQAALIKHCHLMVLLGSSLNFTPILRSILVGIWDVHWVVVGKGKHFLSSSVAPIPFSSPKRNPSFFQGH